MARVALVTLPFVLAAGIAAPRDQEQQPSSDWTLIFNRPATGKYEDMSWPDEKHGWVASAGGFILSTADGGATWTEQAKGLPPIRSIDFINLKHGYAGSITGRLLETTDGGATWNDITGKMPATAKGFCGITHVGKRIHIVGKYFQEASDYFYSPDEGKTWTHTNLSEYAQGLVDVAFLNERVGFITGMAKGPVNNAPATILKTTDGGKNWKTVFTHAGGRGFVWKMWPINGRLLYASLQSQDGVYRIARSTDVGETWDTLTVTTGRPGGPGVQGIGFLDANRGWVGGFFRGMWKTTDGGKTWTEAPSSDGTINRFERVGNTLITAGTRGVLRLDLPRTKGP